MVNSLIYDSNFSYLLKARMEMRGFIVEDEKLEQLSAYRRELMEWNKIMNLTFLPED